MRRLNALVRSPAAGVFGLAALLTLISGWPLMRQLSSALPADLGDPVLETWLLWWNAHTLPFTAAWWNAPMFVPMAGATALSESLLGLAPLTTPLQWMGLGPVAAHNIAFLVSAPLSALAAYTLTAKLTPRRDAALIAAFAFAFAPFRIAQLSHLQVLFACWMPFALAALHDFVATHKTRPLVWFGVCWLLNGFTNGYFLAYFPVLVALWMLWFVRSWRDAAKISAAAIAASLPLLPLLYGYQVRQAALGLSRGINEIKQFSADLSAIFAGSSRAWLSSHWTLAPGPEGELYPGVLPMLLVIIGIAVVWRRAARASASPRFNRVLTVVSLTAAGAAIAIAVTGGADFKLGSIAISAHRPSRLFTIAAVIGAIAIARTSTARSAWRARSPFAFYTFASAAMLILALGPEPTAWNRDVLYRAPYWWLMQLPGFDSVRVPARFGVLMIVALSQAGALAFTRLFAKENQASESRAQIAAAVVVIGIAAEGWLPSLPIAALPPSPAVPARAIAANAATIELPLSNDFAPNTIALLNGLRHQLPMLNGFGGYIPAHYHAMRLGLEDGDATVLDAIRRGRTIAAYIDKSRDGSGQMKQIVASAPGAEALSSDQRGDWYLLPALAPAPVERPTEQTVTVRETRVTSGPEFQHGMYDSQITTGWHSRPVEGQPDSVELDFGKPVAVSAIEMSLGPWTGDFPRDLRITAVDNGASTIIWQGRTAGMTVAAALESTRVRLRIDIPNPVSASSLRLTSFSEKARAWSIADLKLFERAK